MKFSNQAFLENHENSNGRGKNKRENQVIQLKLNNFSWFGFSIQLKGKNGENSNGKGKNFYLTVRNNQPIKQSWVPYLTLFLKLNKVKG